MEIRNTTVVRSYYIYEYSILPIEKLYILTCRDYGAMFEELVSKSNKFDF